MGADQVKRHEETKFGVHLLVVIFGTTSWSIMNGLWVELPILVTYLPEGWTLPSYLTIITQFGFLGLLVFILISYLTPGIKMETPASFVIVTALTLCALLYSFFWSKTTYIAGTEYSVALLGLTFSQAAFAAMTSIAYVTFMAHLKARYMASIFVGMGLSGLIPALAAIGQGTGSIRCVDLSNQTAGNGSNGTLGLTTSSWSWSDSAVNATTVNSTKTEVREWQIAENEEPPFSIQGFFLLLFCVGVLSLLSLVMLVFHPYCKSEHVDTDKEENCMLTEVSRKEENKLIISESREGKKISLRSQTSSNDIETTLIINSNIPSTEIITKSTTMEPSSKTFDFEYPLSRETTDVLALTQASYPATLDNDFEEINNFGKVNSKINKEQLNVSKPFGADDSNIYERNNDVDTEDTEDPKEGTDGDSAKGKQLSKLESWFLLALLVWINALQTSFVLAIQVYSSLPYGIQFYHAATKGENIVDPIASLLTFWISASTTKTISGLTFLGTLFTAYIVTVASMSPNPFLVHETAGGILVVTAWVMCTMLMVFSKVSIANVMRGQGRVSLMWTGGSTQLGALLGAVLSYLLINQLHLFKDEPWCR